MGDHHGEIRPTLATSAVSNGTPQRRFSSQGWSDSEMTAPEGRPSITASTTRRTRTSEAKGGRAPRSAKERHQATASIRVTPGWGGAGGAAATRANPRGRGRAGRRLTAGRRRRSRGPGRRGGPARRGGGGASWTAAARGGYQRSSAKPARRFSNDNEQEVGEPVQVDTMILGSTSVSRARVTTDRSARRQTVRAWCRRAAAGVPPGITNDRSGGSFSSRASIALSRRRTCAAVTAALARFAATLWVGSASCAPIAKRSLWMPRQQALEGLLGEGADRRRARRSSRPRRRRRRLAGGPWGRARRRAGSSRRGRRSSCRSSRSLAPLVRRRT